MIFNFFYMYSKIKKKNKFKRNTRTTYFKINFCLQKKVKYRSLFIKNKAGRSQLGNIIFRNKTSCLKKYKQILINYSYRVNKLALIASFQYVPFKNKLLSLIYYMDGSVAYFNATDAQRLFMYSYVHPHNCLTKHLKTPFWSLLVYLKKLIFISFFEKKPGDQVKYVRSPGTKSKVLTFDRDERTCFITLPSKQKLLISTAITVFLGQNAFHLNTKFRNVKAGYWRIFGKKPIVRGVAMNAVDHPHGGRTKAIKYPRTPWGKTTKYK